MVTGHLPAQGLAEAGQAIPLVQGVINRVEVMEANGKIGPHQGIELKLMLEGKKPLAKFAADNGITAEQLGDADFAPYVKSGRIKQFTVQKFDGFVEWRIYCLPGEEWRAKLCVLMLEKGDDPYFRKLFDENDLHRIDGALLGYEKTDVEFFIETITKRRIQLAGKSV